METSVDKAQGQVSYGRTNPLFEMSVSRSDLYSFQPEDVKSKRPTRQWCLNVIIVYLLLLTGVNIFLLYKVFTLESSHSASWAMKQTSSNQIPLGGDLPTMIRNTSQETISLRSDLGALQTKVNNVCGAEGQLGQLRSDLSQVNTSTYNLEGRLAAISLTPGAMGMKGAAGPPGPPGAAGLSGPAGAPGQKGDSGVGVGIAGPEGPKGDQGEVGPQGLPGQPGPAGRSGPAGPHGLSGPAGPNGAPGQAGPPGVQGSPGLKGDPGASGVQGPPGTAGARGEKGDTGVTGRTGIPGLQGSKGDMGVAGVPGPAGASGAQGPAGSSGAAGARGSAGSPGPPGVRGPPGEKGDRGSSAQMVVRLIGGSSRGRVEVLHNGVWGTVCDDHFDTTDGTVICRMLGYRTAIAAFTASPGSGNIWLDDLRCTGSESNIFACPHGGVGSHNCSHGEDAGVQCA